MHYTEGEGRVDIGGGKYEFEDENQPIAPGTVDTAEYNNAVQFEIANAIIRAGIAIETSAANDRANGWQQLATAIFDNEAIDTPALADESISSDKIAPLSVVNTKLGTNLDFGKFATGTIAIQEISGPTTYDWVQRFDHLEYTKLNAGLTYSSYLNSDKIEFNEDNSTATLTRLDLTLENTVSDTNVKLSQNGLSVTVDSGTTHNVGSVGYANIGAIQRQIGGSLIELDVRLRAEGIEFGGSLDPGTFTAFQNYRLRQSAYSYSGNFTASGSFGNWITSSSIATGLPSNSTIIRGFVKYTDNETIGIVTIAPVRILYDTGDDPSSIKFIIITNNAAIEGSPNTGQPVTLFLEYNAQDL